MSLLDVEKVGAEHIDRVENIKSDAAENSTIDQFTPEGQKMIVRRIDVRLVTTLGLLYCASLMDRTNLGSASIAGMTKDLGLATGSRYSLITLMFFIPYVLFQPPALVALRKVGPRRFLSAITIFWGATVIGFGFVKHWTVMLGLRVILGVLEAGFYPSCVYLLSTWYTRYELQKRNAVFYLIGSLASALSGILAYGLMQMNMVGGLAGWRWIFIMEGIITAIAGVIGYFMIVDFPEKAANSWKFLSKKESDFIVAKIQLDRHDVILEPFRLDSYLKAALDLKVWGFACLYGLITTNTYAIAYFLPIILRDGMHFSLAASQCLVAPPYVCAAIVMFVQAWYADKSQRRAPTVVLNAIISLVGLPLLGFATNNGVRYFGVFLATIGCNANIPAVLTYQANNVRGQWKRALTSATLVGFGGIGGIIGSTVFRAQDSPAYHPGIMTTMIANGLIIIITALLTIKFRRANNRVDVGGKPIEGQIGFKYTI